MKWKYREATEDTYECWETIVGNREFNIIDYENHIGVHTKSTTEHTWNWVTDVSSMKEGKNLIEDAFERSRLLQRKQLYLKI